MEDCAGLLGKTMNSAVSDCYVACLVFSISSLFPADVTADVLPEVSTYGGLLDNEKNQTSSTIMVL